MKILTSTLISALLAFGSIQGITMSKDTNLQELQTSSALQLETMRKEIDAQYSQK